MMHVKCASPAAELGASQEQRSYFDTFLSLSLLHKQKPFSILKKLVWALSKFGWVRQLSMGHAECRLAACDPPIQPLTGRTATPGSDCPILE